MSRLRGHFKLTRSSDCRFYSRLLCRLKSLQVIINRLMIRHLTVRQAEGSRTIKIASKCQAEDCRFVSRNYCISIALLFTTFSYKRVGFGLNLKVSQAIVVSRPELAVLYLTAMLTVRGQSSGRI